MKKFNDYLTSLQAAKMPEKKSLRKFGVGLVLVALIWMCWDGFTNTAHAQSTSSCHGKFPDPITDVYSGRKI